MRTRNQSRDKIRFLISLLPGVHLRQVQRLTGMSFSSTRYHIDRLTETGDIVRQEDRGYSRLFPAGTSLGERLILSLLQRETDRRIIVCLAKHTSLPNKRLAHLTRLAKSTISQHLARLTQLGVVSFTESETGGTVYRLNEPSLINSLIRSQTDTLLSVAKRRFIDLWDF